MRRLVWACAGRTYHIVGNLMSQLTYVFKLSNTVLGLLLFFFFIIYKSMKTQNKAVLLKKMLNFKFHLWKYNF